jgi:hypothetical protein
MSKERLLPLTGLLFLVLLLVSFTVGGEPPGADEDVQEIVEHYVDNKDSILIGAWLTALAAVALVFFGGYLRRVLSDAGGRNTGTMLPGLVLVGASIIAVGGAIDGMISFAIAEAADDVDPTAVQALQALWDNDFLPIAVGTIVFLLSAGIAAVRTGALPAWLGWVAIALGIIGMTPIGFVAAMGGALWIAVTSILLAVREA